VGPIYKVVQKKIIQSLNTVILQPFATRFSPKCLKKITDYQSMKNLYKLAKYSLINSQN